MTRKRLHRFFSRDVNEPDIRAEFTAMNISTWQLADQGIPDLLCYDPAVKHFYLVEVKAPGGRLNAIQTRFRDWATDARAPVFVADHIDDVPRIVENVRRRTYAR